jgi:hypothetical protein
MAKDRSKQLMAAWNAARRHAAPPGHGRLRAYFAAGGVDPDKLPAAAWKVLGFDPECLDYLSTASPDPQTGSKSVQVRYPAMVARCDPYTMPLGAEPNPSEVRMLHRTYLHPTEDLKRPESMVSGETARKYFAADDGAKQGTAVRLAGRFPGGVMLAGEGIETTAAVMAATGWGGWAYLDAAGVSGLTLPAELVDPDAPGWNLGQGIHTIILLQDLDRSRTGVRACDLGQSRVLSMWPWVRCVIASVTPQMAPGLVEAAGTGELLPCPGPGGVDKCERGRVRGRPCAKCRGSGEVGWSVGEVRPAIGLDSCVGKGADWRDVVKLFGVGPTRLHLEAMVSVGEAGYAAATSRFLSLGFQRRMKIIDSLERQAERSPAGFKASPALITGSSTPPPNGGAAGSGGGNPPAGRGGQLGGDFGDDDAELVVCSDNVERPVLPLDPLVQARQFVRDHYWPGGGRPEELPVTRRQGRAGSRPLLMVLGDQVYRYTGVCWYHVGFSERVLPGQMRSWLVGHAQQRRKNKKGDEAEFVQVTPSDRGVGGVVEAVLDDLVILPPKESRFWMKASFDENGRPIYPDPWQRVLSREQAIAEGLPPADRIVVTSKCLIDVDAIARGDVERIVRPGTPRLFCTNYFPIDIPVARMLEAIREDLDQGDVEFAALNALAAELAPLWCKHLLPFWFQEDHDAAGGRDSIRKLQLFAGYLLTPDTSHKNMNIAVMVGVPDTGKSTCVNAMLHTIGSESWTSQDPESITDQFSLYACVDKAVVVFPEFEMSNRSDAKASTRVLKAMFGNDPMSCRPLYGQPRTVRFTCKGIITCNEMPDMSDSSGGITNRLQPFNFKRLIDKPQMDSTIGERLMTDPGEQIGRFLWMLAGLCRLIKGAKAAIPAQSQAVMATYRGYVMGDLETFIKQTFEVVQGSDGLGHELTAAEIFHAWTVFAPTMGHKHFGTVSSLMKRMLTPLQRVGWNGTHKEHPQSTYTHIKLSGQAVTATEAARAAERVKRSYDGDGRFDPWDQKKLPI